MTKRGKKLLSWVIALVLVLGLVPWISLTAKAEGDEASTSSDSGNGGSGAEAKVISIDKVTAVPRAYEKGNTSVDIAVTFWDGSRSVTLAENTDYTVTGTMESDTAGDNKTVNVTVMLNRHVNADYRLPSNTTTTTVNITKATPTTGDFTYEATTSLEYDGTEKTANVTSDKTGMGKITVGYYSDEERKTPVTPTAVGTYYVAIDVGEGTNYSAASRLHDPSWTFTINKETPPTGDFAFTEPTSPVDMFRLYNPNSGEHFYTGNEDEKDHLVSLGWNYEGVAWYAPESSSVPVYRLYNPNAGDHHYTMNKGEKDILIELGWNDEGIGWYSVVTEREPIYRLYNPNATTGTHHFTASEGERDYLISLGWKAEGIGWYGIGEDAA